jgi:hypothetical protein
VAIHPEKFPGRAGGRQSSCLRFFSPASSKILQGNVKSWIAIVYHGFCMHFPIKVCVICSEEFELKPDKPGFANRCPECSTEETNVPVSKRRMGADERKNESEANEARRQAIRDLLYRKDLS